MVSHEFDIIYIRNLWFQANHIIHFFYYSFAHIYTKKVILSRL